MKFSFYVFMFMACVIAALCIRVDAQDPSDACVAEPHLQYLCDLTDTQMDRMLEQALENITPKDPLDNDLGTTATRRRHQSLAKRLSFNDVKDFFGTYWNRLKTILQGKFDQYIFNDLKAHGSYCESSSWIVRAAKVALRPLLGEAITGVCDCLYPMIKQFSNYQTLFDNIIGTGLDNVMPKCPRSLRNKILGAITGSRNQSNNSIRNARTLRT
ncbi:hypothetical protein BGX28_004790 [Mortierella sp. GBA30]|nr:hypothetical protein BGX28_004790 [Mortierella sp. GBA30]